MQMVLVLVKEIDVKGCARKNAWSKREALTGCIDEVQIQMHMPFRTNMKCGSEFLVPYNFIMPVGIPGVHHLLESIVKTLHKYKNLRLLCR
jgi:hypothetical protein